MHKFMERLHRKIHSCLYIMRNIICTSYIYINYIELYGIIYMNNFLKKIRNLFTFTFLNQLYRNKRK